MRPPKRVHLPSGRVVAIDAREGVSVSPRAREPSAPLFSELAELVAGGALAVREKDKPLDLGSLELRDFHALRAVAMRVGWVAEELVEVGCRNCDAALRTAPCAALELGPFVDGELDDPELDVTLDLSRGHPIPAVPLRGGRTAREVTLRPVTLAQAAALHRALRRRRFVVSERVVAAMGVAALGPERDPRRIADALSRCSDAAWGAIGDLFLLAHYPPRLRSIALCPECGARNDVDAPYEREFEPSDSPAQSNEQSFPDFDAFDARARELFERHAGREAEHVMLVVDSGVPACDDGGDPLLGAYLPPGGDPSAPVGVAEITVYYRSFRAMWEEDGPYDWVAELDETIEHELEHHDGWRVGHDPTDDEERAEIARERMRTVGRKTAARESVGALGADLRGFLARTWPIWVIVAVATFAITVCGR